HLVEGVRPPCDEVAVRVPARVPGAIPETNCRPAILMMQLRQPLPLRPIRAQRAVRIAPERRHRHAREDEVGLPPIMPGFGMLVVNALQTAVEVNNRFYFAHHAYSSFLQNSTRITALAGTGTSWLESQYPVIERWNPPLSLSSTITA